jgi:aminoglycoside phosphotransferase (APT) family kinase protein
MGNEDEKRLCAWIEEHVGGRVVECEREPRWRPAWMLELERPDGERLPIHFRGDRGISDHGVYALEHEFRVLQLLERDGIPVPHVYGFCEEPRGIVMERSPGRPNLGTAETEAERNSVQDHYMEILARIHALDPAPYEAADIKRPTTPEELGLSDFEVWERGFRRDKKRPEPLIEFVVKWIRRNIPVDRDRVCFVCSDAGQFLFDQGRVTALLDLELAHLGDPAEDLAGMRNRDLSEPLGDLNRAIRRYEEIIGAPVDRRIVDFHTVRFAIVTPLATAALVAAAPQGVDLIQYLCWYHVYSRAAIEVMADMQEVTLERPELPAAALTRQSSTHDFLVDKLTPKPEKDGSGFAAYEGDAAARVAEYLRRADRYGPALEAEDLDEVAALLGRRPAGWAEADAALEEFVLAAEPERDAEIIRYLYRRTLRQEALLQPVMRELTDVSIQLLD